MSAARMMEAFVEEDEEGEEEMMVGWCWCWWSVVVVVVTRVEGCVQSSVPENACKEGFRLML